MAEARQAVAEFHVYHLEEGREPTQDFIRGLRKNWVRRFYTTRYFIIHILHVEPKNLTKIFNHLISLSYTNE